MVKFLKKSDTHQSPVHILKSFQALNVCLVDVIIQLSMMMCYQKDVGIPKSLFFHRKLGGHWFSRQLFAFVHEDRSLNVRPIAKEILICEKFRIFHTCQTNKVIIWRFTTTRAWKLILSWFHFGKCCF